MSAYDCGVRDERRQTVLAEAFGVVAAASQCCGLRVPNTASLINHSYAGFRASCPVGSTPSARDYRVCRPLTHERRLSSRIQSGSAAVTDGNAHITKRWFAALVRGPSGLHGLPMCHDLSQKLGSFPPDRLGASDPGGGRQVVDR